MKYYYFFFGLFFEWFLFKILNVSTNRCFYILNRYFFFFFVFFLQWFLFRILNMSITRGFYTLINNDSFYSPTKSENGMKKKMVIKKTERQRAWKCGPFMKFCFGSKKAYWVLVFRALGSANHKKAHHFWVHGSEHE